VEHWDWGDIVLTCTPSPIERSTDELRAELCTAARGFHLHVAAYIQAKTDKVLVTVLDSKGNMGNEHELSLPRIASH
jgi:hypothetical protein